jgi:hypothetical protein
MGGWSWLRHRGLGARCSPPAARCYSRHSLLRAPGQLRHLEAPPLRLRTRRRPPGWTTSCSTRTAWTWLRRPICTSERNPLPSSTTLPPRPPCSLQPENALAKSRSFASRLPTARSCANCRPRRRSWPRSWANSSGMHPSDGTMPLPSATTTRRSLPPIARARRRRRRMRACARATSRCTANKSLRPGCSWRSKRPRWRRRR